MRTGSVYALLNLAFYVEFYIFFSVSIKELDNFKILSLQQPSCLEAGQIMSIVDRKWVRMLVVPFRGQNQ